MFANLDIQQLAVFLVTHLTGGLGDGPQVAPGIVLALVLIATAYIWVPAIANMLARPVTSRIADQPGKTHSNRK